jgi:hypothetical protein
MRAIFGLVGILVVVAVIVWFLGKGGGLDHTQQVLQSGESARRQVNQFSGNDPQTGARASESADLEMLTTAGKPSGILVTAVVPGGAYETYFGLKRNDTIVAVEYNGLRTDVKNMSASDEEARNQVLEAYQKRGRVFVVRNEQEIALPQAPAAQGRTGSGGRSGNSPLQDQLDAIQNIPGAR